MILTRLRRERFERSLVQYYLNETVVTIILITIFTVTDKEKLNIKKDQRILFALVYPPKVFVEYMLKLQSIPLIIRKPFTKEEFLYLVEDNYMHDMQATYLKECQE
jgi:hypothetical protein